MNCQDITHLLDDADIAALDAGRRAQVDAHLAHCADCAAQWRAHAGVVKAQTSTMPGTLAAQCRQRVAASAAQARRASSMAILAGTMVAVAAAAAMLVAKLAVSPDSGGPPANVATLSGQEQALPPGPSGEDLQPVQVAGVSVDDENAPQRPKVAPFRVVLAPIDTAGLSAADANVLDLFHSAMARSLVTVPGLQLDRADAPLANLADGLSVRVQLAGSRPDGARAIAVVASLVRRGIVQTSFQGSDFVAPGSDIELLAAKRVESLRLTLFPDDGSLREELFATLTDPLTDGASRVAALGKLLSPAIGSPSPVSQKALYRSAIDLMTDERDSTVRESVWNLLQGRVSAPMVEAAVDALGGQSDPELRLKLVTLIGSSYRYLHDPRLLASMQANSPQTHQAMEAAAPAARRALADIAANDPSELMRMTAMRAFSGPDKWNEYVASSLGNASLPDADRLEAFASMAAPGTQLITTLDVPLDAAALRTVGRLVIRAGRDPQQAGLAIKAVKALAGVNHDAARDALLHVLEAGSGLPAASPVRAAALVPVMMRHGNDPVVRKAVEKLAASDPDPLMQRRAGQVLQAAEQVGGNSLLFLPASPLIEPEPKLPR